MGESHISISTQTFDRTARKFHQALCLLLLAAAYVVGSVASWWLVMLVGVVMLAGRYWWPADIFRQLAWRVLEPAGILPRQEVHEDHETRRVARALGGAVFIVSAFLLVSGQEWAWIPIAAIAVMIFLDAAFDF